MSDVFFEPAHGPVKRLRYGKTQWLYDLQPGESWAVSGGLIVVVHPERKPKVVFPDGTIRELEP